LLRSARNDDGEDLGKIGARHSEADKERIKQTHDLLVELDADCCPGAGFPGAHVDSRPRFSPQAAETGDDETADGETDKLAKSLERSLQRALAKALGGLTARMDEFATRLKKIENQPLPLGSSSVRAVEKQEDSQFAAPADLLDRPGALEALADFAIRKAHSSPMRAMPVFKSRE
jgi:hypothetical protein